MKKITTTIVSLLLSIFFLALTGCKNNGNEIPKLQLVTPKEKFVNKLTTKEGAEFTCSDNYYLGQEAVSNQFCFGLNRENPGNKELTLSCSIEIDYMEFFSYKGIIGSEEVKSKKIVIGRQYKGEYYDSFILYMNIEGKNYSAKFYIVGV